MVNSIDALNPLGVFGTPESKSWRGEMNPEPFDPLPKRIARSLGASMRSESMDDAIDRAGNRITAAKGRVTRAASFAKKNRLRTMPDKDYITPAEAQASSEKERLEELRGTLSELSERLKRRRR
jgi:hypothetical protein